MTLHQLILCFFTLLLGIHHANATHVYGAEITYQCIGNNQYIIELELFQDCGAIAPTSSASINIASTSCAISQNISLPQTALIDITPVCPGGTSPCLTGGYGTYRVLYSDTINIVSCSDWIFSYTNCCRGASIVNLATSSSSNYVYTSLDNSSQYNNAAKFTGTGYVYAFLGQTQSYYSHAYDLDGDSLVFSLSNPLSSGAIPLSYSPGYAVSNPLGMNSPTTFDPQTGKLTFTANIQGSFIVGLQVEEYRNGVLISSANKDIYVVVFNGANNNPDFTVSNVQGGYLEDNVFHVTDPSQLSFDIVATDTTHPNDTLTFSSDIAAIGGSFTSSGTNPATASFTWPKSIPLIQEFTVSIVDNNCSPLAAGGQYFGFAIKHYDNCIPDSVQAVIAADSILSICAYDPNSLINTVSPTTTTYGTLSIDSIQNLLLYTAGSTIQVQESFWAYLSVNNGPTIDSVWVDVTTTSCVWAGDADTNKIVNHFDLLPLGLGYGQTGPIRPNAGIDYDCEPALNFVNSTPVTGTNYKHSDTNGDGLVDDNDTMAIVLNWGQIHAKNGSSSSSNAIPFYVEHETGLAGQMLQVPIMLGDSTILADSIYGIAFTINYDETMVDTNSVFVDFNTSWLGTIHSDMISVQKDFYYQGKIDVAVVRTDQTNRDGMGQIGSFNLTIKDDILKKATTQRLDLVISDVRMISNIETESAASTPPTGILVTLITPTDQLQATDHYVNVFPNPAKTKIQVQTNDQLQQLSLYNLAGQIVVANTPKQSNATLDIQNLPAGIYILKVQTAQHTSTQKVQITR